MYIPTSFFSSQGACITATTTSITGSGAITTGSFISGGVYWQYYQFANTLDPVTSASVNLSFQATLNILSGSTGQAKLFLVAGGGAGGYASDENPSIADTSACSGGGGGGGIVYYNNFPLASGSYAISVGAGGGNPLNSGIQGRQGANTTFTYNIPYTPFTSSVITAYGGGKGGYASQGYGACNIVQGVSGGSAGGAVCCPNQDGANNIIQACCDGLGGLNGANQGNDASGCLATADSNWKGSGGGGAGTIGALATSTTSVGGDGAPYNLTGTTLYYAAGGGGARGQDFPIINQKSNDGNGSAGFGNGGQGQTLSYAQGTTATNGVAIIAIPLCSAVVNTLVTVYQMEDCCSPGTYYNIAVQPGVTFGLNYTIFNPELNKCMHSVAVLSEAINLTFLLTPANQSTYVYGSDTYGGDVQCLNCRQANGLSGCLPIGNTCTTWTFRYTANLPTPPSSVSYVDCTTGNTLSFNLSPANRNGSACVRTGTTPTVGANIIATQTTSYCGVY
jgi:hypothetical protein